MLIEFCRISAISCDMCYRFGFLINLIPAAERDVDVQQDKFCKSPCALGYVWLINPLWRDELVVLM